MRRLALTALLTLSACSTFPEVDARTRMVPANAPYPTLLPLDQLNAAIPEPKAEEAGAALEARAAALRARAARLRNTPVGQ